jgi:predicted nucleic acid-binding protein
LRQTLDNGEAEAIAFATELQPEVLFLNDQSARRMARRLGVPVTGTLGVLLRAKQLGPLAKTSPTGLKEKKWLVLIRPPTKKSLPVSHSDPAAA